MKVANIVLRLDKAGHDVGLSNVTPAEALVLVIEHHSGAGGDPILSITPQPDVERSNTDEMERLEMKYSKAKLNAVFGTAAMPTFPSTFDEAVKVGIAKKVKTVAVNTPTAPLTGRAETVTVADKPVAKG